MEQIDKSIDKKIELGYQTSSTIDDKIMDNEKSHGVARMEAISSSYTKIGLCILAFGILLVDTAYALDSLTRGVYQTYATNSFETHSLISTLNVVQSVVSAAIQPSISVAANIFGRFEMLSLAILFYAAGTVIEACSKNIETFAGGQVIYTIGSRAVSLMFVILIADVSSTRNRVLYQALPSTPYLIITWISGNVTKAIITNANWEWGVGMWAIIIPMTAIPIYLSLFLATRKAKKQGKLDNIKPIFTGKNYWENAVNLFWQIDLVGSLLLGAVLCLLLIPLTIAGGAATRWAHADVISMLVIGFLCIPIFAFWEIKYAKYPCVPFHLLNNRVVLACLLISFLLNACWYLQGDYLYTVLMVSFDQSIESATRITSLYPFTAVIVAVIAGLVIRYVRRIKWVAVSGILLYTLALGLMIKFRSSADNGNVGVVAAQVALGFSGGLITSPVQTILQTETNHEHMALLTALYLTTYTIGAAVGNSVSGAIWTNTLPGKLAENFASFTNATDLISTAYGSPLTFILDYPMGTPERLALTNAYDYTQKILTITGCCMAIPLVIAAFTLSDPVLGDTQSLPNTEKTEDKK